MGTFDAFDIPRYSCVPNMPPPLTLFGDFYTPPPLIAAPSPLIAFPNFPPTPCITKKMYVISRVHKVKNRKNREMRNRKDIKQKKKQINMCFAD